MKSSRTFKTALAILIAAGVAAGCATTPPGPDMALSGDATPQEIERLFDQWNASLQTGNPAQVANHYASDAILLPTISNQVMHNREEIKGYFDRFLELKPRGVMDEQNIRIFGDIAINSGVYTFSLVRDGQPATMRARYTFVYRRIGDRWFIIEHHSSAMPGEPPS
ncbi:MAG: SgcJ/EcaC family oxidoreductase [Gammaproteobacteria bacterium]